MISLAGRSSRSSLVAILLAVLVGLYALIVSSFLAGRVIVGIDRPLFTFSLQELLFTFGQTIAFPLLVLLFAVGGFYFGLSSGANQFDEKPALSAKTGIIRTWARVRGKWTTIFLIVLSNTGIIALVIISNYLFELFLNWLWPTKKALLFDKLPISYLFDAIDLSIIVYVALFTIFEIFRTYQETPRD